MSFLITTLQIWTLFFVIVKLIESLSNGALSSLLSSHNIKLHFCFISFHTIRFNDLLETFARRRKPFLSYWYSSGVFFGLIGLLLSLFLLTTNICLALQDLIHPLPLLPIISPPLPPPQSFQSGQLPARSPRLHHAALSLSSPRAPAPHVPFLHHAPRPWYVPPPFWHRLSPRDHSAAHMILLSERSRIAQTDHPSRRFHPAGLYDMPPPMPPPRAMRRRFGMGIQFKDPFRPPCRKRYMTPWNPAALPRPDNTLAVASGGSEDEEQHLVDSAEGDPLTISSRRKPLEIEERGNGAGSMSFEANETREGEEYALTQGPSRKSFLTPLVPGVTVPVGDIWYMIAAVLIAAVVHELGHALAAGMQNARVSRVGGFVALALPGAYVQLDGVEEMTIWAQLKVYCAGAWHNLVTAFLALLLVGWLPLLVRGGYYTQMGASVVGVPEESPLKGHVEVGDIILKLGRFEVKDGGPSFRQAVSRLILTNDTVGFCVPEDLYRNYSQPRSACCSNEYLESLERSDELRYKCFRVHGIERRTSCIDPEVVSTQPTCRSTAECSAKGWGNPTRKVSLEGRKSRMSRYGSGTMNILLESSGEGETEVLLDEGTGNEESSADGKRTGCFIPVLPLQQQLVDIRVQTLSNREIIHFFYEGYPQVLGRSISVSSYVPRIWWWGPRGVVRALAYADLPNMVERLLQYLSSISLALAILNMAPVLFLDGEASAGLFVRLLLPNLSKASTVKLRWILVWGGSILLGMNLFIAMLEIDTTSR